MSQPKQISEMEDLRQRGIRPNMLAYSETPLLSVGKRVRVECDGRTRRADIDCLDPDGSTADVAFVPRAFQAPSARHERELGEATVATVRIRALEDFETRSEEAVREALSSSLYEAAGMVKDQGNSLFKLKDYDAAIDQYSHAIAALQRYPSFDSCRNRVKCVLTNQGGVLVAGEVESVDDDRQSADLKIEGASNESRCIKNAPCRVLISVHDDCLLLQSSLYMNRARALAQVGCNSEAGQDLAIVIALWSSRSFRLGAVSQADARAEQCEQLTKAYCLRAKTRIARLKFQMARRDVKDAWKLEPNEGSAKLLRQLERDIDVAEKEQLKCDRRLAKEIAKVADIAVQSMNCNAALVSPERENVPT